MPESDESQKAPTSFGCPFFNWLFAPKMMMLTMIMSLTMTMMYMMTTMMTTMMTMMTCMRRQGDDNQEVVWHRAPSLLFTSCPYNRHHLCDFSFPATIRIKFARGRPLGEVSIPPTPRSHSTFDTKLSSLLQMKFEKVSKRIRSQELYPGRRGRGPKINWSDVWFVDESDKYVSGKYDKYVQIGFLCCIISWQFARMLIE